MAELQEALKLLSSIDWEEVPQTDLSTYLPQYFTAGELLCNSVPLPPNGTPLESIQPHFTTPDSAKSVKDLYPSPARPRDAHDDFVSLQKHWGKPMKFTQKENPLQVALYKMAGHDRHGAWFARHNIFEGISFSKFKKAVLREFPETLLTQGAPGAGAIRGLSAERRIERIDAGNGSRVEVYQLSGQMPPPVSPRDFLTLFLTSDQVLTDKSPIGEQHGETYIPRHFMIVSKAVNHPEAPPRSSYVRGSYQSVELTREIPLHTLTGGDPELNPIEWIMVTRSDPAGGLPRFLIDRGTPGAMLADVTKFLNWACGQEEIPDPDGDLRQQQAISEQFENKAGYDDTQGTDGAKDIAAAPLDEAAKQASHENPAQQEVSHPEATTDGLQDSTREVPPARASTAVPPAQSSGILSTMTTSLQAGIDAYAPTSVSNFVHKQTASTTNLRQDIDDDSSSTSSSDDSFLSANELTRLSTAPEYSTQPNDSSSLSIESAAASSKSVPMDKKMQNRHDKEVLRIMQQREKLDDKIAKKREAEEAKFQAAQDKDQTEQEKAREKMEKEIQRAQERHQREVEKLEAKREKELRRAEEKRNKKDEQNKLSLVARERDDLRAQADLLRRENALLADQVEALQRENTALANAVGKLGGPDAVRSVQSELKKSGASIKSAESRVSLSSEKSAP